MCSSDLDDARAARFRGLCKAAEPLRFLAVALRHEAFAAPFVPIRVAFRVARRECMA